MVRARAPHALARAVAATVVVVLGAASAHTWAGGDVPTGPGLALVAAVVLGASLLAFRTAVPAWAMLPAVGLAQLGVHESFGLVAGHDHAAAAAGTGGSPARMLLAHLFVTLLTAALWWAGRRAATCVVRLVARASVPVLRRPRRRPLDAPVRRTLLHLLVPPRRGPPSVLLPA